VDTQLNWSVRVHIFYQFCCLLKKGNVIYLICLSIRSIAEKVVEGVSWSFCFWKDVLHQQEQLMTFWYEVEVILFHHCFNDHFLPSAPAYNL